MYSIYTCEGPQLVLLASEIGIDHGIIDCHETSDGIWIYGDFHTCGYPQTDGLHWKILLKWMMTGGSPS